MTSIVVDANVAIAIASSPRGLSLLDGHEPFAPPLLWPEARSALHVAVTRGLMTREAAERGLGVLESGILKERRHRRLGRESWRIADALGWTKTYDAEYLALAHLLAAPIATLDARMTRAAERLGLRVDARFS